MTPWICSRCGEDQVAFGRIPEDVLCHSCHDAQRAATAFTEAGAGIPKLFRGLTRETWAAYFQRPWPKAVESWSGLPTWVAIWGATGTGKTSLATVLLAEHLRTGRRGHWISGPELSRRPQCTDQAPFPEGRREGLSRLLTAIRAQAAIQGILVRTLSHLARSLRHLTDSATSWPLTTSPCSPSKTASTPPKPPPANTSKPSEAPAKSTTKPEPARSPARGGVRQGGRPAIPLADEALAAARRETPGIAAVARHLNVSRSRVRLRLREIGLIQ